MEPMLPFCGYQDEPSLPFQPHSSTSKKAAKAMKPHAQSLRDRVQRFIGLQGDRGVTDEEIVLALDIDPSTARPRRIELVAAGQVIDSGRTRETRSGRQATVWVAATVSS